jgi:hypothetical protein
MPFTFESPGETPGAGTVLGEFILIYPRTGNWNDTCVLCTGIDAEFVSLAPAVKEPHPEVSLFYLISVWEMCLTSCFFNTDSRAGDRGPGGASGPRARLRRPRRFI